MEPLVPVPAPVRPRVRGEGVDTSRLLEEVVEEYADEYRDGVLWITGGQGSGKTTALSHLAAVLKDSDRFAFLDDADKLDREPLQEFFDSLDHNVITLVTRCASKGRPQLRLEPWGTDEILEYLLAEHAQQCSDVMRRLGGEAHSRWDPEIARLIVDQFVSNPALTDVADALLAFIKSQLSTSTQRLAACQLCLACQQGGPKALQVSTKLGGAMPTEVQRILRHPIAQVPLAAEYIAAELHTRRLTRVLKDQLPLAVVEAVGRICRSDQVVLGRVEKILQSRRSSKCHAMAASILLAIEPTWQPSGPLADVDLSGGYFSRAQWSGVNLAGLPLQLAEFYEAQLVGANFSKSIVVETDFVGANMQDASFEQAMAVGSAFEGADLRRANLCKTKLERASLANADLRSANLWKANLCGADLSNANFEEAVLQEAVLVGAKLEQASFRGSDMRKIDARRVDFRGVDLTAANLEKAWLKGANLEDVVWSNARLRKVGLRSALLTGSRLASADMSEADLSEASLGEIDWENANLCEANLARSTFHMGSSRSGLVDSPIASEGSRTGFYTDDLEELYFKSPEELRKANLRGADLRGADITHVDFYLVDLREAKLDPFQLAQARRTGAILSE